MKLFIKNKSFWRLVVLFMLAVVMTLSSGCGGGTVPTNLANPKPLRERTLFERIEDSFAVIAQREPGRDLKGAVVACDDAKEVIEDWGLAVGRLPNNLRVVYLVWADKDMESGRVKIPSEDEWECPMGKVKLNGQIIQKLLQTNNFYCRGNLNERQHEQLSIMASMLMVKYRKIEIVPLFAAVDVNGKSLCTSMMRMLAEPATAIVCVLPAGYAEEHADWRERFRELHGGSSLDELPNVCAMMSLMAGGYALNLFDLQYHPKPAPHRPAKSVPAPERKRVDSLALLETVDSRELMSMARQSGWNEINILKELAAHRKDISGKKTIKMLNHEEELVLLDFVRKVMVCRLANTEAPEMPQYSKTLLGNYGCSITLRRDGKVLGTVSQMATNKPLPVLLVVNATKLTADEKHPVTLEDVQRGKLEIGVITPARRLSYKSVEDLYSQLKPGQHGVVLRAGGKSAGFVPVVWKSTPDPRAFMVALCRRCGQTETVLTAEGTEVSVFEVHTFKENE